MQSEGSASARQAPCDGPRHAPGAAPRLRLHAVPFSTNVARIALAAAHKRLPLELVWHDPADRSQLVRLSGQPLVPVLVLGDGEPGEPGVEVVGDSPVILRRLEALAPEPPLLPADPHERAAVEVFCDWFNLVWKRPPNAIDGERRAAAAEGRPADDAAVAAWAAELRDALRLFEGLLARGPFLFGERLTLADATAWPFLSYPVLGVPAADAEPFHHILVECMPLGSGFPRLRAWVERVAALPEGQAALATLR